MGKKNEKNIFICFNEIHMFLHAQLRHLRDL